MITTELVYSSHDRCAYLHGAWIVERALAGAEDTSVFYLPFSSGDIAGQEYSWGTFAPYLERFRDRGLQPRTFFWTDSLRPVDVELFFEWLAGSEVVILGGGRTLTGLQRYRAIGEIVGNPEAFGETLRDRQSRGKLTVGFSAGADQLCQCSGGDPAIQGLGLVPGVAVRLHFEPGQEGQLQHVARLRPDCLVFGLPNDSGVAASLGTTAGGRAFQVLHTITDMSWDRPADQFHIKTRWGVRVEHRYADGRDWQLNGGDEIVRVFREGSRPEAWIKRPEVETYIDYWTQDPTAYRSLEEILAER